MLEITNEGTNDVKRARKHALIQENDLFKMQPTETIAEVHKRFTHIANHLIGLGKDFEKEELNINRKSRQFQNPRTCQQLPLLLYLENLGNTTRKTLIIDDNNPSVKEKILQYCVFTDC